MVKKEVKTDSDAVHVFTNGLSKEVKGEVIKNIIANGFLAEGRLQSYAQI